MKKIIIGISFLLIAVLIVIKIGNAQSNGPKDKKAANEAVMDCSKCPSVVAGCGETAKKSESKVCDPEKCKEMGCDPAKCKEMGCDPAKCKTGKYDPATCKNKSTQSAVGMKKCCPAI